jgi:phenylacetate-coenzyme A ligase PaaK-like adenylate-forming protein
VLLEEHISSRSDLDRSTDKKIRAITRLAYDHNPFLHHLFETSGMNPHSDISGKSDLLRAYKRGVRTTGADVEKLYADYAPQLPTIEIWSSGSSARSKKILVSRDALIRSSRGQERRDRASGIQDGQKVLRFSAEAPYATSISSVPALYRGSPKVRTLAFHLPAVYKNIAKTEKARLAQSYIDMIYEFNPDHLRGGVFAVYKFARFLMSYGLDTGRLSVKAVHLGGDPTTEEERRAIGKLWNAEPYDSYSSTEVNLIAYECHSHSGMHLNENELFVTSVDPGSGEEVGENEIGRDLCTSLYEDGEMPATFFLNYSHGDTITTLGDSCTCGDISRVIAHPTRDTRKKLISGFGFDIKEEPSVVRRAVRKIGRSLS